MIRGIYTAASALDASVRNQEIVAENIAHAATPGFRRHGVSFEIIPPDTTTTATDGSTPAPGTLTTRAYTTFDAGPLQRTGNPLDLSLNGDVFFVLDGPTGPVLTRSGVFRLNAQGELESSGGLRVRGTGGPIAIPAGASRIEISQDGGVRADSAEVGKLQIAYVPDPSGLRRVGTTLFEGASPQPPPENVAFRVDQGYREGSNVNVVIEMVSMMTGLRLYEAAERALKSLSDATQLNTQPTS